MFPGLDLYYADPAQPLTTAGEELDMFIDHDLSDPSEVWYLPCCNVVPLLAWLSYSDLKHDKFGMRAAVQVSPRWAHFIHTSPYGALCKPPPTPEALLGYVACCFAWPTLWSWWTIDAFFPLISPKGVSTTFLPLLGVNITFLPLSLFGVSTTFLPLLGVKFISLPRLGLSITLLPLLGVSTTLLPLLGG